MDYVIAIIGVLSLLFLIPLVNKLFTRLYKSIETWCQTRFQVIKIHNLELVLPTRLETSLIIVAKYFRSAVVLAITLASLILVFSLFPGSHSILLSLFDQLIVFLGDVLDTFISYWPNFMALVVIAVVTRAILKLLRFLSDGIKTNKIKVSGVHPELIEPTVQLARFLVIAFALVTAYPYIPGSDSPVFRGVSIFVGFLLSLGSTSLVANIVSGVVLTYTRGLKVGDRVEISDAIGDVIDRNLLVTRIRTIKNVVITIPNAKVLNNHIINYSTSAQQSGLILHTTVSIGYDVPWRQVHELLTEAARSTENILAHPKPFVHQTSLDDYYISYELNAYTRDPARMAVIYSELHQSIQDKFNEAGVEILSPAYSALRDGSASTIPPNYPPLGYYSNFFRRRTAEDTQPIR